MTINQSFIIPIACDETVKTLHVKTGSIDNCEGKFFTALVGPLDVYKTKTAISPNSACHAVEAALDELGKEVFVAEDDETGKVLFAILQELQQNGLSGLRDHELITHANLGKRLIVQVHRSLENFENVWRVFPDGMNNHYAECETALKMEDYVKHLEKSGAAVVWHD